MTIFNTNRKLPEVSFQKEKEFEEDIYTNSKLFFGEKSILINLKTKLEGSSFGSTIPDGFLFELSDAKNPEFYLIEVELSKHNFHSHIFPQITKFFSFFKNSQQRNDLTNKLFNIVDNDISIKQQFKEMIGEQEICKFINDLLENSQNILIVIDGDKNEFSEISDVYHDTWGKMVKHMVLRKYSDGQDTIYHLNPDFEILEYVGDEKVLSEKGGYTEKDHTEGVSENTLSVYEELKRRVLSVNSDLIFNPTKYYISIKNVKNIAFIYLKKQRISLVVLRPENEIRKIITKCEVKSLVQSVQGFYNGPCADIIIGDIGGMDEVVELLRPLIESNE